jgi:subtilisin family serine protease/DNA/RNA endonuclease YhcR with UshA esterase domain
MNAQGGLDVNAPAAQQYIAQLEAEQTAFVNEMQSVIPDATVGTFVNEYGMEEEATYQIVMNAVTIDPGTTDRNEARRQLAEIPGVKYVYLDLAHEPALYASNPLINAPTVWNSADIGGRENAGSGVKFASMDGGVHKDAPMFDGSGYSYPSGFPKGHADNCNGKIIASRVYFRPWDPPAEGEENPWPGETGTPHGVHTSGIAAGDVVTASYLGVDIADMSGVAPKAWVMSYRVFYNSVTNNGSFYNAEGIAALEDIVADGADVLNNSWGGGPTSAGGEFDALDTALINVSEAGIFVSMSAGNAGPGKGTTDHPSDDYINVAATTTTGTLASGVLNVIAPEPISSTLQSISYGTADFGDPIPIGTTITHTFATAADVDPTNITGCDPFPTDAFDGVAAVISRGGCYFSDKVRHAEEAGATFAVIYNNDGDGLINMGCGDDCTDITISSVFIGQTYGEAMVNWYTTHGTDSVLELDTEAFQAGNEADYVASFSSRGPGVGHVLKPDIAAPGVNILSQGYTPGATGEARHLGYGQASGTSMAAPHVAGAAVLLRQMYPSWTNAEIKSAMMSTAKYMEIYNHDGSPAQPLDIGAGRLDIAAATDPGVIFDPPSLSFGAMTTGTTKSMVVDVTNITTETETYDLSTLYTGNGFAPTQTTVLTGFVVTPVSFTLNAGASTQFTVTFDTATGQGIGDNQGYILLDGDNGHDAHLPAWARVQPEAADADVLIIGSDFSYLLGYPDYSSYYTDALDDLGLTYEFWNADRYFGSPVTIPDAATLYQYDTILIYTGDHWEPDGTFTVPTPFTALDMNRLMEYLNGGGTVLAMGQDLSAVLASDGTNSGELFYQFGLGGNFLQDSVTGYYLPDDPIVPYAEAPPAFNGLALDLSGPEIYAGMSNLLADNVVTYKLYLPLVLRGGGTTTQQASNALAATISGQALFAYDSLSNRLDYEITLENIPYPTDVSVTLNQGAAGENGPVAYTLLSETTVETDTMVLDDAFLLEDVDGDHLLNGELYIAVKTTESAPFDTLRGQIMVAPLKDGAANQYYVDELAHRPDLRDANPDALEPGYVPLLKYPGGGPLIDGIVAMSHRDQPTLETPGITYFGRSIYTSFGLEGVNGEDARAGLLQTFMDWAMDEPTVTISDTTTTNASNLTTFQANVTSTITGTTGWHYRWDFGDGSDYTTIFGNNVVGHDYEVCGPQTVRVEVTDTWGNKAVGSTEINVENCAVDIIADARSGSNGDVFSLQGIVTYVPGTYNSTGWALQDDTGGIAVFDSSLVPTVSLGDHVWLVGERGEFNGEEQMTNLTDFANLGSVGAVTPISYTTSMVDSGATEGWLVEVTGTISNLTTCSGANFSFDLDDGSGAVQIYVDETTGIDMCSYSNSDTVTIQGFSTEYNSTYQVKPRFQADIN